MKNILFCQNCLGEVIYSDFLLTVNKQDWTGIDSLVPNKHWAYTALLMFTLLMGSPVFLCLQLF